MTSSRRDFLMTGEYRSCTRKSFVFFQIKSIAGVNEKAILLCPLSWLTITLHAKTLLICLPFDRE